MIHCVLHDPKDSVAVVVVENVKAGMTLTGLILDEDRTLSLPCTQDIPLGHKVALRDLAKGDPVRRYNVAIGFALEDIGAGRWVHEQLIALPQARALDALPMATRRAPPAEPLAGYTFQGYRNADGSVGTRNILALTTTVQCVSGVVEFAVERIR